MILVDQLQYQFIISNDHPVFEFPIRITNDEITEPFEFFAVEFEIENARNLIDHLEHRMVIVYIEDNDCNIFIYFRFLLAQLFNFLSF